ncbi:chromate efflux transporter [Undibacterium flavidum]|uniref:Chromate efflux transporter n=1 Tax=Undibacterium flavidum TaxID=2762297 RepID=A0ABR6YA31_9BURK|nr:chromate efflux transporter [Undibacterium flavidum]MBC3873405.1 chromate efflux transporter [Undibacterium flavidum]
MQTTPLDIAPPTPSFRQACQFWLKLGCISFGGPAGQIAIMHQELVEQRRWISEKRFLHALNYCMLLPGPEAQQLATYLGWLLHGTRGGVIAGALFVLPSLFLLIALSWLYIAFGSLPIVAGIFYGIKPAVTAIVIHAAHRIGSRTLKNASLWAIAGAAFVALFALHLPFPLIILSAAVCGYIGGRFLPQHFHAKSSHAKSGASYGAAVIDDTTPSPDHARFSWWKFSRVLFIGFLLWLIPMFGLYAIFGWQHSYTQMAWFFSKAALMTFGGAYAVLPYVMQAAVEQYRWLTPAQMIDGLALGESTPGPLIMVLSFVGFVTAYVQALFGPEQVFLAGAFAAILVSWFTFLPSFIFILAGGPLIESSHHNVHLTPALTAITAAVVGVLVNLALFFVIHVVWPQGLNAQLDYFTAGIALVAAFALFRLKLNVILVLAGSAVLGLLHQFLLA